MGYNILRNFERARRKERDQEFALEQTRANKASGRMPTARIGARSRAPMTTATMPRADVPYLPEKHEKGRLGDIMRASPKELRSIHERMPTSESPVHLIRGTEQSWFNPGTSREYGDLRTAMTGFRQRPQAEIGELRKQSMIEAGKDRRVGLSEKKQGLLSKDKFADRSAAYKQAGKYMNEVFPADVDGNHINPRTGKPFTQKEWAATREVFADQALEYASGGQQAKEQPAGLREKLGSKEISGYDLPENAFTPEYFKSLEGFTGEWKEPPAKKRYPTLQQQWQRTPQQGISHMGETLDKLGLGAGDIKGYGKTGLRLGQQTYGGISNVLKSLLESQAKARRGLLNY